MRPVYLGSGLVLVDANRERVRRVNMSADIMVRIVRGMLTTGFSVCACGQQFGVRAQSCQQWTTPGLGIVGDTELLQLVTYR
jgi:hypothetical protein